ncbi:MAG: tetratricopeptide repeat protein [Shewanella sp.]|nr:tetratricopeptide repeat protein [Shewanella sp.]
MSSSHVQTRMFDPTYTPKPNRITLIRPHTIIDYFPDSNDHRGKSIKLPQFIAKYYNNKAAEALADDRIDTAFKYAVTAYKTDKSNPETFNLLAVLHRRAGDFVTAEQLYLAGMHYDVNNLRLLSNYIVLLNSQERLIEANRFSAQLAELKDPNPYNWLEQAYIARDNQHDIDAIKYYRKVIKLAPYVQSAYLGLYQMYLENQRPIAAQKVLTSALEWSYDPKQRLGYKYKLYQLTQSH